MEYWKDVKEYEGYYQVSNLGRVKSLERFVKHSRGGLRCVKENILRPAHRSSGYLKVEISKEGKTKIFQVHQLVAMSFLNHTPCGHKIVCDHIDNNPLNNNVENLQLISNRENATKDQFRQDFSSKFIGVFWNKRNNKWQSAITINGKKKHLGLFKSELEASKAYQKELKTLES